jgi:DNA-binding transcriptional LysR family regulator
MALRFDLTDLRLFLNVVEAGTLTAGAQASHLALASASARILAMEDSLGSALLVRQPRGVQATPAGRALAKHAALMLQHGERMRGELADYAAGLKGHVRLLANTVAMHEYLPEALGAFLVANAQVNVSAAEATGDDIVMALAEGTADVGVFSDEIKTYELETYAFTQHRLVLVTPMGHALALQSLKGSVSILEADACDVIGLPEGSALQDRWEARAARRGVRLNYRVRVPSFDAQCRLIESGAGVALLPEATALRFAATMRLCVVPLTDAWLARQLLLAVRRVADLPAFTQRLVKHLTAAGATPARPPSRKMAAEKRELSSGRTSKQTSARTSKKTSARKSG